MVSPNRSHSPKEPRARPLGNVSRYRAEDIPPVSGMRLRRSVLDPGLTHWALDIPQTVRGNGITPLGSRLIVDIEFEIKLKCTFFHHPTPAHSMSTAILET